MAIHTLKTPLNTVSKPDFSPQLGLAFRERAIWSNQSVRLFSGLAAICSDQLDDGLEILLSDDSKSVKNLVDKYRDNRVLNDVDKCHYYATTALVELTNRARARTAINTRQMQWLVDDNPMAFEIIATVGKAVVSVDCAGVFSHHYAEASAGQRLDEPQMQFADLWYKRAGGLHAFKSKK